LNRLKEFFGITPNPEREEKIFKAAQDKLGM
jgi:hypothetical protein